jgi:hypothetical protein
VLGKEVEVVLVSMAVGGWLEGEGGFEVKARFVDVSDLLVGCAYVAHFTTVMIDLRWMIGLYSLAEGAVER